jgi:hypothetical protein
MGQRRDHAVTGAGQQLQECVSRRHCCAQQSCAAEIADRPRCFGAPVVGRQCDKEISGLRVSGDERGYRGDHDHMAGCTDPVSEPRDAIHDVCAQRSGAHRGMGRRRDRRAVWPGKFQRLRRVGKQRPPVPKVAAPGIRRNGDGRTTARWALGYTRWGRRKHGRVRRAAPPTTHRPRPGGAQPGVARVRIDGFGSVSHAPADRRSGRRVHRILVGPAPPTEGCAPAPPDASGRARPTAAWVSCARSEPCLWFSSVWCVVPRMAWRFTTAANALSSARR